MVWKPVKVKGLQYCLRLLRRRYVGPERFKTQAANFPEKRWENWYATGNFGQGGSEAAPWLQGRIAIVLSSNSLVSTMDMTDAIQYILTAAQSVRLSGLLSKVSNDDTWACWCIILGKLAGIDKMDYRMFRRKYLLGCLGKLRDVSTQQ